jgi:hypothetical protein
MLKCCVFFEVWTEFLSIMKMSFSFKGLRRMKWVGHVAYMGKMRNVYKILVGKPEGKRPLRRARLRLEDRIEIRWENVDWVHVGQDSERWRALVNMIVNILVS